MLGAAVSRQTKKSPVPTWKRKSATTSGCKMSFRYTWGNTFITASYDPSPAGNIKWLAMWRARKIMTRASADTPWATRNGAGTRRAAADACASLSDRSNTTMVIAQHATHGNVSGTALFSMLRTTPRKTNKVGAATASRAVRFARNCATVGRPISEKCIAASIAIRGIAKARARHAAAFSHDKVEAPYATMCATLVWKPSRAKGKSSAASGGASIGSRPMAPVSPKVLE